MRKIKTQNPLEQYPQTLFVKVQDLTQDEQVILAFDRLDELLEPGVEPTEYAVYERVSIQKGKLVPVVLDKQGWRPVE